jgi:hypothetical protein
VAVLLIGLLCNLHQALRHGHEVAAGDAPVGGEALDDDREVAQLRGEGVRAGGEGEGVGRTRARTTRGRERERGRAVSRPPPRAPARKACRRCSTAGRRRLPAPPSCRCGCGASRTAARRGLSARVGAGWAAYEQLEGQLRKAQQLGPNPAASLHPRQAQFWIARERNPLDQTAVKRWPAARTHLKVQPSAYENSSRAMSRMDLPSKPGSHCWMK